METLRLTSFYEQMDLLLRKEVFFLDECMKKKSTG